MGERVFYKINKSAEGDLDINYMDDCPEIIAPFDGYAVVSFSKCTPKDSWEIFNDTDVTESILNDINSGNCAVQEPAEQEIYQAETLLNQAEIIAKQKEQDEVLAAILLGQQTM